MNEHEPMKHGGLSLTRQINAPRESVSLAGVEFKSKSSATELTYIEQGLFLIGEYNAESRTAGTNGLLNQFSSYVEAMK